MPAVLEFQSASLAKYNNAEFGLSGLTLALAAGQSAWLETEIESTAVDLACGLRDPESGQVLFQGESWSGLDPQMQADRRGRIGRVFWDTAWISNLDVDENITLAKRHLHAGPPDAWMERVRLLSEQLGFMLEPGLRPAFASARDLQRAQYVRALLGTPELLILENPDRHVSAIDVAQFVKGVEAARKRGAAVLWVAPSTPRLNAEMARADLRLDLRTGIPMVMDV